MIESDLFLAFVAAVTLLMLIPGPNVALFVATSLAHGTRSGFVTLAGTSSAMVLQLALTGLGLSELLGRLGGWFEWLRWLGVTYLLYLGLAQWRAPPADPGGGAPQPRSCRALYGRALLISLSNPKVLLFYGAFFPQFVTPERDLGPQVALLSATFLAIALLVDSGWVLLAGRARRVLAARGRLRNRLSGGLLIGAGLGLAMLRGK